MKCVKKQNNPGKMKSNRYKILASLIIFLVIQNLTALAVDTPDNPGDGRSHPRDYVLSDVF